MNTEKISIQAIQLFSSAQAWEYLLVPFELTGNLLKCYGISGHNYDSTKQEIEVLSEYRIEIFKIEEEALKKMLRQYYRQSEIAPDDIQEATGSPHFLTRLTEQAFDVGASDIHFEPFEQYSRIRFRIDGKLIERYHIEKENYAALVNQIKILSDMDISEKRLPQDGRILYNRGKRKFDIRVSSLPAIYGEKIVMRLLTRRLELLELNNLGFTKKQLNDYCNAIEKPHGLVLICGPTGSGKSTTLYATLRRLNREVSNILTIEDPVEYTLEGVNQVQLKEDIGLTFAEVLRTFLRQDPDIIMLGEIRDSETASMAIRSSLTGHLIFSTIHTNSAWGCVSRLNDMGVHPYLIADTLIMCVAQRLVRKLCPYCKKREGDHFKSIGCPQCYYTGYSGRRALYEVIPMDDELSLAVRRGESDITPLLETRGITSIKDAAQNMLDSGETSFEVVLPLLGTEA